MLRQGDRNCRFCIVACVLVILQVAANAQDVQAATADVPSDTLGASSVLGYGHKDHGPHYREEHPHYKDGHMKDDYSDSHHKHHIHNCPSCNGTITTVFCYEDAKGRIQDIVFLNPASKTPVYPGCSGTIAPTREPSKSFFVPVNESIVWVETCDGKHEGELAAVTFVTDKKTRFTCGTKPSFGKGIEALAAPVNESTLAEASGAEEAEEESVGGGAIKPQSVMGKHRKHGKHEPKNDSPYGKPGYGKDDKPYGKDSYGNKPGYGKDNKPGYGKDSYGEPGKDYYKTEHEYHGKHGYKEHDYSSPYEGDYGYHGRHPDEHRHCSAVDSRRACGGYKGPKTQVYPLASFDVTCTPKNYVKAITELCYNTNYTGPPPPPPPELVVEIPLTIVLELSSCPTTPQEISTFQNEQQLVSDQTRDASKDAQGTPVIALIAFEPYNPSQCTAGNPAAFEVELVASLMQASADNATLTSESGIVANPPYTSENVTQLLSTVPNGNLCEWVRNGVDVCEGTRFVVIRAPTTTTQALDPISQATTMDADAISFTPQILATPSQAQGASNEQQAETSQT